MRIFIYIVLSLFCLESYAQVNFVPETYRVGLFGSFRDCVVDMNGDFKDDIVGVTHDRIDIAYQVSDGFEFNTIITPVTKLPRWSICAGDIDANGYNDLMLGESDRVGFLYADANGSDYTQVIGTDYIFSQRTTFVDINEDGHLDAFVCHDLGENQPYRNDGQGNLVLDMSMVPARPGIPGNYISTWVDYDNDDDLDIYLTKCFSDTTFAEARVNILYNNDGNGNFTEVGPQANMDDDAQSWVTLFEDFDNDGDFDAFTLNHTETNRMKRNNNDGTFTEVIQNTGLDAFPHNAEEALAADFDNDGDMDILVSFPPNIFFNNGDMTFVRFPVEMMGGALGDLNDDGFLDILSADKIYMNQANGNHWLRINPIGRESNRNAIGARMELYGAWGKQVKELRSSASWTPMSTLSMHFGIGQHTQIDSLVIKWPSGRRTVVENPPIDQAIIVDELDCPVDEITVEIIGNTNLCGTETVTLIAPEADSYLWSTGETTRQIVVSATGRYNVKITDAATGCDNFTHIISVVNQNDPIDILTPDGTTFCEGTPVRLEIDTDRPVTWSTGETTKTIWITAAGDYTAQVLNECGELISSVPVQMTALDPEPPQPDTIFVTQGSNLAIELDDMLVGSIVWWTAPVAGALAGNQVLYLNDVQSDTTFYAQHVITLPNGQSCGSDMTAIFIDVLGNASLGYRDNDGDGYGNPFETVPYSTPTPPDGVVENNLDCDDNDPSINPNAMEIPYDGKDNDCNIDTRDDDLDGDGLLNDEDCDDMDTAVGGPTIYYNDGDGDGFGSDDVIEACSQPAGFVIDGGDCNDLDASIYPGAEEICDGMDNNCDFAIDEGFTTNFYFLDSDGDGYGDVMSSVESCLTSLLGYVTNPDDCNDMDSTIYPGAVEIINNGIDEDCNGSDLTSIFDLSGHTINIYPSPASNFIYVDVDGEFNYELRIYDMDGRLHINVEDHSYLDVSELAEGTYLLNLEDKESGRQVTDRVVIVR